MGFQEFINSKLKERGTKIKKQGYSMNVDSSVAQIFANSKFIAGIFYLLSTDE